VSALIFQAGSTLIAYRRDKYYGIFSGVEYAGLATERKKIKKLPRNVEKILVEPIFGNSRFYSLKKSNKK
jgi:hypothetical protein